MKTTLYALVLLHVLSTVASADEAIVSTAPPPKTIGADAMLVMPVGDYADVADAGLGVLGRIEIPAGPGFVTGRAGAIFHVIDAAYDGTLTLIPMYAGYRMPIGGGGVYLAGELGLTIGLVTIDTPFGDMSDSDTDLGLAAMAGWRSGALDLRGGLFTPDTDDAVGFVASAGYDFAAF